MLFAEHVYPAAVNCETIAACAVEQVLFHISSHTAQQILSTAVHIRYRPRNHGSPGCEFFRISSGLFCLYP